eukprot:SAG31_NODE_28333_length_411_cov_1.804487_1_plen_37_part_10
MLLSAIAVRRQRWVAQKLPCGALLQLTVCNGPMQWLE